MSGHVLTITIASEKDAAGVAEDLLKHPSDWQSFVPALIRHLSEHTGGIRGARVAARVLTATAAAGLNVSRTETVTVDQSKLTAGDELTVGLLQFEWADEAAAPGEVAIGDTSAEAAANMAAVINQFHTAASASAAGAVISITVYGDVFFRAAASLEKTEDTSGAMTLSAASFVPIAEGLAIGGPAASPVTHRSGL
jgi:hypothetical protein